MSKREFTQIALSVSLPLRENTAAVKLFVVLWVDLKNTGLHPERCLHPRMRVLREGPMQGQVS